MAVNNWFQSWGPPAGHFAPDYSVNYSRPAIFEGIPKYSKGHGNTPANILPFLLRMGLLQAPPESQVSTSKTVESEKNRRPGNSDHSRYDSNKIYSESTGPFMTKYAWKQLDFKYTSDFDRDAAIRSGEFIPENNLPLGIELWKDRLFVTMPKWKNGVPATLAVLPREPKEPSPQLVPYPNWDWHKTESCEGLTSIFRIQADDCGRLWVLDSGQIEVTIKPKQVCPPAIYVFDLSTDDLLFKYELPEEFIKQDSLYSNIVVDNKDGDCSNVHAYLTDVWRYGLVVYSLKSGRSWRIYDHLFYPDPLAAAYKVHDLEFEWTDGIFGLALSPWNKVQKDRILYYHPMSSFREFYVKTSVVCNETGWEKTKNAFRVMGQSRGKSGQVSASAMDRNGIMFYNLVTRDAIGCWDSRKPYKRSNLGVVAQNSERLIFPNDLKIDKEKNQNVWIISNRLPFYLYKSLDKNDINFRIMSAEIANAIKGTICEPELAYPDSFIHFSGDEDCY
ncbi:protein yellow [Coccinella septempunctata]|uniref:protein yellow n=1 Tax=Coccinella septempunctata TaxID=41139 RepID=UPI001D068C64|nr:protein yellow [Coccinella septempunctata]